MPANTIKSFADKTGKSEAEVEKLWDRAKEIAKEAGEEENYAYVTGVLKKMLNLKESFIDYLAEERSFSFNGFQVDGQLMSISLGPMKYNDMIEIKVSGNRMLAKLKSAEHLKSIYQEEDWDRIEEIWAKTADKYSKEVETLTNKFERDLNKIVIQMEKELGKY